MSPKIFNSSSFNQYTAYLKTSGLSPASINRKLSSLTSFQKFLIKKNRLSPTPTPITPLAAAPIPKTNFFQKLSSPLFNYLVAASLLIIASGIGYTLYRQTVDQAKTNFAYTTASNPVYADRFLSFQGRLTDTSGNPINSTTSIRFDLFNSEAPGTGTNLYSSSVGNSQVVTPDDNGIFSVTIGKTHGLEIPNSVFTENPAVFLQITAGGEVMSPRQPIATVAYAINAESLQGLPPSASGLKDTVLVIDHQGNLNLGETSPTIKSTSGTLGIEGQAVLIKAADGSGGNITINPDANGTIKLITEGTGSTAINGFIDATNANLAAGNLYSATINNTNRTYNFLDFRNYDIGTTQLNSRFTVDAWGNTFVGGTLTTQNLAIGSTALVTNLNADYLDGFHASEFLQIGQTGSLPYVNDAYNSTLTRYGSGPYTLALNLGSTNTWLAPQTFQNLTIGGTFVSVGSTNLVTNLNANYLDGLSSTSFLQIGSTGYFNTAVNGLSPFGVGSTAVGLGGTLIQNTTISQNEFNLSLTGNVDIGGTLTLTQGASTGYILTSDASGNSYWAPNTGIGTTYAAGVGLTLSGYTFNLLYDPTLQINANNQLGLNLNNSNVWTAPQIFTAGIGVSGDSSFTNNLNVGGTLTAATFITTGDGLFTNLNVTNNASVGGTLTTQNLAIGSTALVTNLNADYLDGLHSSSFLQIGQTGSLPYVNNAYNSTLTRFGTGPYTLALNLGSTNTWLAPQTFNGGISASSLSVSGQTNLNTLQLSGAFSSVGSTAVVINLNADYLDGKDSNQFLQIGGTGYFNTAVNGLSPFGVGNTAVGLGGTLIQNTVIDQNNFNLGFINGNIGLGTTSPTQQLDMTGNINLTNTTFANQNGIVYTNGTRFLHNFNYGNNGTVTTNGQNIFLGENAGNFTMGSTATSAVQSSYNIGIGSSSLYSNTIGSSNTALGSLSLQSNTTGNNIVAIGSNSLQKNTTGNNNTAIGAYTLFSNTTGYYNTALGHQALFVSTTGYYNTALGVSSLSSNTTGSYNTTVGNLSLRFNTSGYYNLALGQNAGSYLANGSTGNTSPDKSIYIGVDTKSLVDDSQNEIVIGYNAIGNGSNSVTLGADTITKTILKGNVGIGTASPEAKLQISQGMSEYSTSFTYPHLKLRTTNTIDNSGFVGITYDSSTTANYGWSVGALRSTGGNSSFIFKNHLNNEAGVEYMRINHLGNVGIGTTAPTKKLDIAGDINLTGTIFTNSTAGTNGQYLTSTGTGLLWQNLSISPADVTFNYAASNTQGGPALNLYYEDNRQISPSELAARQLKFGFTSYNNSSSSPYADFLHFRSYGDSSGGKDNLLVINKADLGMRLYQQDFGSTAPYSLYKDITLSDNGATVNYIPKYSSGGNTVSITNSQIYDNGTNVGIGTTNPLFKLTVDSTVDDTLPALGSPGGKFALLNHVGRYGLISGVLGTGNVFLQAQRVDGTATAYNILLQPNGGNVGIGTASPRAKLHVGYGSSQQVIFGDIPAVIGQSSSEYPTFGYNIKFTDTGNSYQYLVSDTAYGIRMGSYNRMSFLVAGAGTAGNTIPFTEAMSITNTGNVGIGTASPENKLTVVGSSTYGILRVKSQTDNGESAIALMSNDDSHSTAWLVGKNIGSITNDSFSVFRGSNRLVVDTSGNVGIGTDSPGSKLYVSDVASGASGGTFIINSGASQLRLGGDGSHSWIQSHASQPLYINELGNNTILNLNSNVGIGTASPGQKLEVVGNIKNSAHILQGTQLSRPLATWSAAGSSTGAVIIKLPGTASNYGMLHMQIDVYEYGTDAATTYVCGGHNWNSAWYNYNCHTIGSSTKKIRLAVKDNQYAIVLGEQGSTWSYGHVVLSKISNGGYYPNTIDLGGTYTITQDNNAESYTWISANLNKTVLEGSGVANYVSKFTNANTLTNSQIYDNGTNVGIGTASPENKLTVVGSSTYGILRVKSQTDNGESAIALMSNDDSHSTAWLVGKNIGSITNDSFSVFRGSNRLVVDTSGNVGIGRADPQQKLDVAGNIRVSAGYSSNIIMEDWDESPNGIKYIHANSNNIGFLSGGGSWLTRWDDAGVQRNTSTIYAPTMDASGYVYGWELYARDNVYLGYMGNWLSNLLNQSVRTDAEPTFPGIILTGALHGANRPTDYYDLNAGSIGVNTAYAYNSMCTGNASGSCDGTGGVVLGRLNTSAYTNFPNGSTSRIGGDLNIGGATYSTNGYLVNTADNISTRINSGWYQTSAATQANGWPETTNSWYHLFSSTHSNLNNYYALQIAGSFYGNNSFFIRSTEFNGAKPWKRLITDDGSGNVSIAGQLDAVNGYISSGNQGGTGNAAYFPSGIYSPSGTNWLYGSNYFNGTLTSTSNNWYLTNGGDLYLASAPRISSGSTSFYGWGTGSWPPAVGGYNPYTINNHTGLAFSAHSSYGGIRFYNQGYPDITTSNLTMSIVNNKVGINTDSPSTKLTINHPGAAINTTQPGTAGDYGLHFMGQTTQDYANGITWNGGTGTSGAQAGIYVQGSGYYGTKMYFGTTNSYANGVYTRMMIDANGRVGIGIGGASPAAQLEVGGSTSLISNASGNINVQAGGSGGVYLAPGAGAWAAWSDVRLKNITGTFTRALDDLMTLTPIRYTWKNDPTNAPQVGLIAQQVDAILPEAISTNEGYLGVKYTDIIPLLTAGIQELNQKLDGIAITDTGVITTSYPDLTSPTDLLIAKTEIESASYTLTNTLGKISTNVAQFAQFAAAKIKAGFVSAANIITTNLIADRILSRQIDTTQIISPLANIDNLTAQNIQTTQVETQNITTQNIQTHQITANSLASTNIQTTQVDTQRLVSQDIHTGNLSSDNINVSGELYADQIFSKEGSLSDIMAQKISSLRDELKSIVAANIAESTPSAILAQSDSWSTAIATDSAAITGSLSLTDNLIVGAQLMVNGDSQFGNALVTGRFVVGETIIKDNLIETSNTALFIQPSRTGSVHIMGDTLVIADNGQVTITGDLTVTGSLFANLLQAQEIATAKLTAQDIQSTSVTAQNLTSDNLRSDKLNIATDSSSLIIASDTNTTLPTTTASVTSNATAGTTTLPATATDLVISTNKLTANSMVYLTPVGSTNNQVLYIKNKIIEPDQLTSDNLRSYFTIALDQPLDHDININWWIIN